MKCRSCGHIFDEEKNMEISNGCMGSKCILAVCPECGYDTLLEVKIQSKLAENMQIL